MKEEIAGRQAETKILERLFKQEETQLIAVYGRRRIGKTHLIREFYRVRGLYLQFTGVQDAPSLEQLANFHDEHRSVFSKWADKAAPKNWREAFQRLVQAITPLANQQRIILFFDEVPWMASHSGFLKALEYSWNQHLSTIPGLVVVLCGSCSSWMINRVIQNKGGLHGRLAAKIHLQPFTLAQTERFLKTRGVRLARQQIVELYMVLGGVAQYLKAIPPGTSPAQSIQELCFSSQGLLFREFYPLYRSLFNHSEKYIEIVQTLANYRSGLSKNEILEKTHLSSGGTSTRILRELEESGIIFQVPDLKKKKKGGLYRLLDEYSLFFLKWIHPAGHSILLGADTNYWQVQQQAHRWSVWAGYAFENICFRHILQIKRALGLAAIHTTESGWYGSTATKEKAQIDLVIDRADRCINLCEMKFNTTQLRIDKKIAEQLERKRHIFREATQTKKSLFTTLITPFGVIENSQYLHAVDQQLTLEDLFSE